MEKDNTIPEGVTCHYERINGKWFVVWGADFMQDRPGRKEVAENEAFLLECGYLIGKAEK
jgi:hypothetical protein